jgi:hypothetical protein
MCLRSFARALAVFLGLIGVVVGLAATAHHVGRWEKANDYPFGRLCDVYNTCNGR